MLGIPGSLRAGSYNLAVLRAAHEVAPEDIELELTSLAGLPVYNADDEALGDPLPVCAFKRAIRRADALLIATPEYNYSIPGALKNAIVGASTGIGGTANAQRHLRESLLFPGAQPMPEPELLLTCAHTRFDSEGRLQDEAARET